MGSQSYEQILGIQADCSTFFYEYDIPEAVADLFIKAEGLTISLTLRLVKLKLELEPHLDGDEVFSSQK
jgi:hypothetical protein